MFRPRQLRPFSSGARRVYTRSENQRALVHEGYVQGLYVNAEGQRIPESEYRVDSTRDIYVDSSEDQAISNTDDSVSDDSDSGDDSDASLSSREKRAQLQPKDVQHRYHLWDEHNNCFKEATVKRTVRLYFEYTSSDEEEWLPPAMEEQPAVEAAVEQPVVGEEETEEESEEEDLAFSTPASQPAPRTDQLDQPASRPLTFKGAAIHVKTPAVFEGDEGKGLDEWRSELDLYCKVTGSDRFPGVDAAIAASLLGDDLKRSWLAYVRQQPEEQSLDQLFKWLEGCTVEVNRLDTMYDELKALDWSRKEVIKSAAKVPMIAARGAGNPAYPVSGPFVVGLVKEGMEKAGIGHLFREVQYMPAVGGEAPKPWTDLNLFLNTLVATARGWPKADSQGQKSGQVQLKRKGGLQQVRPGGDKQPRTERAPLPLPSATLGPKPPARNADDKDKAWCLSYEKELREAGHNAKVCHYCKKAGHVSRVCRSKPN